MTEKLLEERLLQLGAAVRSKTELVAFEQKQNEVQCVLLVAEGARRTVGAKYLVSCDGAHRVVRHRLGLPFSGNKGGLRWILADVGGSERIWADLAGSELIWADLGVSGWIWPDLGRSGLTWNDLGCCGLISVDLG